MIQLQHWRDSGMRKTILHVIMLFASVIVSATCAKDMLTATSTIANILALIWLVITTWLIAEYAIFISKRIKKRQENEK